MAVSVAPDANVISTPTFAGAPFTAEEAQTVLEQNGWAEAKARQAAQLLTTIESSKFSGVRLDQQQRSDLLKQVKDMIRKLAP